MTDTATGAANNTNAGAKPAKAKKGKKKEIWDESKEPLQEGEELVFDNSAYQMLHRAKVEWPCLSIDVLLRDRINQNNNSWFPTYAQSLDPKSLIKDKKGNMVHKQDKFPYTVYFCAGSQSVNKKENKIYVMKWSEMYRTLKDDDEVNDNDSDSDAENDKDPEMKFNCVPHKGCVNRIRSMHGTGIVATWNDENEVGIYNISSAIEALDDVPSQDKKKKEAKGFGGCKIASFKHNDEGYALDWSPLTWGRLASGGCNSQINLYIPADESCSSFVKESQAGLQGHRKSVEDVQFSPS
jgi:ribosome assembly protein RRB1